MSNIIELKNVNKWFDKFQALKDVSLEVKPQEKIVICGPSGSGKSTLIRCINRLEEHQEGQIIVDGNEISEKTKDIEKIKLLVYHSNFSSNFFYISCFFRNFVTIYNYLSFLMFFKSIDTSDQC